MMSTTGYTFGGRLRERREARGLSQTELADMVGVTRSYICHIEAGRRRPSRLVEEALTNALGRHGDTLRRDVIMSGGA